MEISGAPNEGWMIFVPVTVLVLIVVYVLGGPVQFVNTVSHWLSDVVSAAASWLRHL
jgi:uncharacterized protein involved in cysteine biosynthesis